jgi:hypothetical protein
MTEQEGRLNQMALKVSPQEIADMVKRAGDGPMVGYLAGDTASVFFRYEQEHGVHVFKIEATPAWMEEMARITSKFVWARSEEAAVAATSRLWPTDDCVRRLKAVFEFQRGS